MRVVKLFFCVFLVCVITALSGCEREWVCTCRKGTKERYVIIKKAKRNEAERICIEETDLYIGKYYGEGNTCKLDKWR